MRRTWLLRVGIGSALLAAGCGDRGGAGATPAAGPAVADSGLSELIRRAEADPPAAGRLLDAYPTADAAGKADVLDVLPKLLKHTIDLDKCRAVIADGLKTPAADTRLAAVRAAMHPAVGLREAVLPLLDAPEPQVRRAAMFAVGPAAADAPVIDDEGLFRWLHDPDGGVRQACQDALVSRGRSAAEIDLGRRLTNPDAAERLQLLLDLCYDDDLSDPEPWLERLGRDADPGVRAGAARVAVELAADRRRAAPAWVGRLAEADPDATVRRVAGFYRKLTNGVTDGHIRPAGGP